MSRQGGAEAAAEAAAEGAAEAIVEEAIEAGVVQAENLKMTTCLIPQGDREVQNGMSREARQTSTP